MNEHQVAQPLRFEDVRMGITSDGGTAHLLRGISMTAEPGQVVAIVGESGSGKSTLLRSAARLVPPGAEISGSIKYGDSNVLDMSNAEVRDYRASVCRSVFQDPWAALHPMHTVKRQLLESVRAAQPDINKDEAIVLATEALASVGIPDPESRLSAYPHELSGGQLQRVVIAMALLASARVLLCDEVTTALDVTTQATVLELLRKLADESGMIIVLATHDLPMLRNIADKIVVMYAGKVVEVGPTDTVLDTPSHPYTRALLQASPSMETSERLEPIGGTAPSPIEEPEGCAFAPRCTKVTAECWASVPELYRAKQTREDHLAACFVTTTYSSEPVDSESVPL